MNERVEKVFAKYSAFLHSSSLNTYINRDPNDNSLDLTRASVKIPDKIDAFFQSNLSVAEYLEAFCEVNSDEAIQERVLSGDVVTTPTVRGNAKAGIYGAGKLVRERDLYVLFPLREKLVIQDHELEIRAVELSIYAEQTLIMFLIDLCIYLSTFNKEKSFYKNLGRWKNHYVWFKKKNELEKIDFKAWDFFTDAQLLRTALLSTKAWRAAVEIEPLFIQSRKSHGILSVLPLKLNSRKDWLSKLFSKPPSVSETHLRIARALLLFRFENKELFSSNTQKIDALLCDAFLKRAELNVSFQPSTFSSIYFATMRNS